MNTYTIVVPTHDRHQYLPRSIKYFSGIDANVIYIDSSVKPYRDNLPPNIEYLHCPSMTFPQKALLGIKNCSTDYIAFCADDDFLIESALKIGVERLEKNSTLTAAVGRYLGFREKFDGEIFEIQNYREWPNVEKDNKHNIVNFLSNYHQILWAMYRRNTIELAYNIIDQSKFSNDNFIELVIAVLCSGTGGIALIDEHWGVREINTGKHWGGRNPPLPSIRNSPSIAHDISTFIKFLDPIVGNGNAELGLNCYLESFKLSYAHRIVRKIFPERIIAIARRIKENRRPSAIVHPKLDPIISVLNGQ